MKGKRNLGEVLSPEVGESTPHGDTAWSTVQGIVDVLNAMEITVTEPLLQQEEFALQLGVTMADRPGWLRPPSYLWNVGLVVHVLKTDPVLRELEYVQVEAPRTAYLFFHDRHGHQGLTQNATEMVCVHIADSFAEWIGQSAHFNADPILLEEGQHLATVAQERCRQHSRIQDIPNQAAPPVRENQFRFLTSIGRQGLTHHLKTKGAATLAEPSQPSSGRPHHHPPRPRQPRNEGGGGSPPSSPECPGGIDSDGQSIMSKWEGSHRHRRCQRPERRLAPAWLNLPVFRSMDTNTDVTYEIWRFDVQGWLDQYEKVSNAPSYFWQIAGISEYMGSLIAWRYEHPAGWVIEVHGPHIWKCAWLRQHDLITVWNLPERQWISRGVHAQGAWGCGHRETCLSRPSSEWGRGPEVWPLLLRAAFESKRCT